MAQPGSAWAAASNPLIAWPNQKEWSSATARVNSFCAAGLQEVGKLTVPSFSGACWAPADMANRRARDTAMASDRIVVLLFSDTVECPVARNQRASVEAHQCYWMMGRDRSTSRAECPMSS